MPNYGVPAGELKRLIDDAVKGRLPYTATVTAVNEDDTVSLDWGAQDSQVPCASSYRNRQVGDVVTVQRPDGLLLVTGTTGSPDAEDELSETVASLASDIVRLTKTVADLAEQIDPGGGSAPPAPVSKEKVSIFNTGQGSWRPGGQTDNDVKQGAWVGQDWHGGWFYGTQIADACAGRTVQKMSLRLSRRDDGSGWNRGVRAHIDAHTLGSKGDPAGNQVGSLATISVSLSPGEKAWRDLPPDWITELANGTAKGFMASGSGSGSYLIFSGIAGRLDITFND